MVKVEKSVAVGVDVTPTDVPALRLAGYVDLIVMVGSMTIVRTVVETEGEV